MGVVRRTAFHRCRRANVGQLLTFRGFHFKIVLACVRDDHACRRRPVGAIIFCTLLQGSTRANAPRYVFPSNQTPARRPGSDPCAVPGMEDAVDDACTACVGQEFAVGNRSGADGTWATMRVLRHRRAFISTARLCGAGDLFDETAARVFVNPSNGGAFSIGLVADASFCWNRTAGRGRSKARTLRVACSAIRSHLQISPRPAPQGVAPGFGILIATLEFGFFIRRSRNHARLELSAIRRQRAVR